IKPLAYILLAAFMFGLLTNCTNKVKKKAKPAAVFVDSIVTATKPEEKDSVPPIDSILQLDFKNETGYILKMDGIELLLRLHLTDTVDSNWDQFKPTQAVGKYYKSYETGNYVVCLIDYGGRHIFETHVLLELTPKSPGVFKLVEAERYFHGNYPCCWTNATDGFFKMGNFFCIRTCGTGSGFCSSEMYVFKSVQPQDSLSWIHESIFSNYDYGELTLSSTKSVRNNTLIFNYKWKNIEFATDSTPQKKQTKNFSITYKYVNGDWITTDTTKIPRYF
ncbi:MAG: hypothetical protein ACHQF2_08570, partial [Flavobacteriales bacterium]